MPGFLKRIATSGRSLCHKNILNNNVNIKRRYIHQEWAKGIGRILCRNCHSISSLCCTTNRHWVSVEWWINIWVRKSLKAEVNIDINATGDRARKCNGTAIGKAKGI